MVLIKIKKLHKDVVLPRQATPGSAGFDVTYFGDKDIYLHKGDIKLIPTGLSMTIEPGYEIQVRPRSGLALKNGITITNSPGTIDSDYRGPCGVVLQNLGQGSFKIKPGDRIAQFVVSPVPEVTLEEVNELDETERGSGGFGSTGIITN